MEVEKGGKPLAPPPEVRRRCRVWWW